MNREQIAAKRLELKKQLKELDVQEKALDAMTPEQEMAEALHDRLCTWNHTDGCGWFYEIHKGIPDWNAYAHAKYLSKAQTVIKMLPVDNVLDVIRLVKALKD